MADESIDLKRISALSTEATRSDWLANTFFAVDNASIGTKKLATSILVTILNNFAKEFKSDVACVAGKCYWKDGVLYKCKNAHSGNWSDNDFDVATVDDVYALVQYGTNKISELSDKSEGYLALNDANSTGKFDIEKIFNNFAEKFDPTRTENEPYVRGQGVLYMGRYKRFKDNHYGAWSDADADDATINCVNVNLCNGSKKPLVSFVGQGQSYAYTEIEGLVAGKSYNFSLKNVVWADVYNTPVFLNKFAIRAKVNGAYTVLYEYSFYDELHSSKVLPENICVTIPTGTDIVEVGGRANIGTPIYCNVEAIEFSASLANFSLIGQGKTYIFVESDDVVAGCKYMVRLSETTWTLPAGILGDQNIFAIRAKIGTNYNFLFSYTYADYQNGKTLDSEIEFVVPAGATSVEIGFRAQSDIKIGLQLFSAYTADDIVRSVSVIGKGTTYSYENITGLKEGKIYNVTLNNVEFSSDLGPRLDSFIVGIRAHLINNSFHPLLALYKKNFQSSYNGIIPKNLLIKIPNNTDYIEFGCRLKEKDIRTFELSCIDGNVDNDCTYVQFTGNGTTYAFTQYATSGEGHIFDEGGDYTLFIGDDLWDPIITESHKAKLIVRANIGGNYVLLQEWLTGISTSNKEGQTMSFHVPEGTDFVEVGGRAAVGNIIKLLVVQQPSINKEDEDTLDVFKVVETESLPGMLAACHYHLNSTHFDSTYKGFQAVICTDTHGYTTSVDNVVRLGNDTPTVDSVFGLGDYVKDDFSNSGDRTNFINAIRKSIKPVVLALGNHDCGRDYYVQFGKTQEELYDAFIAPLVTKGWLDNGAYTSGKAYYYKDFSANKLRVIVPCEYQSDLSIYDEVWAPVTYDSSKPAISGSATYSAGDIVNVSGYTKYSFQAVNDINMFTATGVKTKWPSYKCRPDYRFIQQDQAQWFLDTLLSTPQDYNVIVLLHNPFSALASVDTTKLFSTTYRTLPDYLFNYMETDFFADAIDAFVNGCNYSANIVMSGDASYYNTEGGGTYAYSVSADFSQKNSGVGFYCFLGGHVHTDVVWKHSTYTYQYQVTSMATGFKEIGIADIRKIDSIEDGSGRDSILSVSLNTRPSKSITLKKIGNMRTVDGRLRDFEIL